MTVTSSAGAKPASVPHMMTRVLRRTSGPPATALESRETMPSPKPASDNPNPAAGPTGPEASASRRSGAEPPYQNAQAASGIAPAAMPHSSTCFSHGRRRSSAEGLGNTAKK